MRRPRSTRCSPPPPCPRKEHEPTVQTPAGFANVLDRCLAVRTHEQVLLLTDAGTDHEVVEAFEAAIVHRGGVPVVSRMPGPGLPRWGPRAGWGGGGGGGAGEGWGRGGGGGGR